MDGPHEAQEGKDRLIARAAVVSSLAWAVALSAVALYECFTVDPWRFIGEDRHAIFFDWSPHLVYDKSAFGDFVMVFDWWRFGWVLLLPVVAFVALAAVGRWVLRKGSALERRA
jgi:hypothetical protein